MKRILPIITASLITVLAAQAALAGSCDHSWQSASDGSNCGDRAADRRAGGR